jgi:hypothetical protein
MVERSAGNRKTEKLSNFAKTHRIFCSEECQRLKEAEEWKKEHPYG